MRCIWLVRSFTRLCAVGALLLAAACAGGGGGGDSREAVQQNSPPVADAGPDQTVLPGATVTLNGAASSDPDGSISTHVWSQILGPGVTLSNTRTISPTFIAPAVTATTVLRFSLTVTDNLGTSSPAPDTVDITVQPDATEGGAGTVAVSGVITFARVPFASFPATGLDYAATRQDPARGITVQALNAATSVVLATGSTDGKGRYSLFVPANTNIQLRVIAQMLRQSPLPPPRWNFSVREAGSPQNPYLVDSEPFNSGTADSTKDIAIPSGWNASTRSATGPRLAAPFAILDTVYTATQAVLAVAPQAEFPVLTLDWSPSNPGGQTFYMNSGGGSGRRIVLAGEEDVDIDEYDPHTIAHEFGHYIEDVFSRSDSLGGPHSFGQHLDMRVAFGEGFAYAFAAIVLNDPLVRDAAGLDMRSEGRFSVEQNSTTNPGWFSEASIQELLWDLFDDGVEPEDNVALGFAPLWSVLTGAQRTTDAMTSIFPFITALKSEQPAFALQIDQRVAAESIHSATIDAFGSTETNSAGSPDVLPIYSPISIGGGSVTVVSVGTFDPGDQGNKLSSHRYLRLDVPISQRVRITASATPAGRDVDVVLYRNGTISALGSSPTDESFTANVGTGTYVLDVYDCGNAACGPTLPAPTSITVTVAPN
jgi:hypothetical protein